MQKYEMFTDMVSESIDHDDPQALLKACKIYRNLNFLLAMLNDEDYGAVAFGLLPHIRFIDLMGEEAEAPAIKLSASMLMEDERGQVHSWERVKREIRVHDESRELVLSLAEENPEAMVEIVCMIWRYQSENAHSYGRNRQSQEDPATQLGGIFTEMLNPQ